MTVTRGVIVVSGTTQSEGSLTMASLTMTGGVIDSQQGGQRYARPDEDGPGHVDPHRRQHLWRRDHDYRRPLEHQRQATRESRGSSSE